jgi:hypothetical protein
MTMYSTEVQQFGLKLEAVRATAESAPAKWYPTRGPVELNYGLAHLADEGLRGRASRYAPIAGIKTGEGKIPMILDPNMCGEIFYGVLGGKSTAQQASTAAYKHSFTPGTSIQKPAYTLFADRSLNVLKYNLGIFKKITLKGGVDNLIELDADVLFKAEASGSIGSPSYPTQRYFSFQNVDFKLAGSSNTDVKEWNVSIDNGAKGFRTLTGSQDVGDIVSPDRLMIDGGFTIYFTSATERDKFIANTSVAVRILMVGAVIESTYYNTVDINLYQCHYKAFPYGEDQKLLAAKVTFEAVYNSSAAKEILVEVTNTDTAY